MVRVPGPGQAARIPWWVKLDVVLALEMLIVFGERQKTVAIYSVSSSYRGQGGPLRDNIKDEKEPAIGPGKGHSTCGAGGGRSQLCSRNWRWPGDWKVVVKGRSQWGDSGRGRGVNCAPYAAASYLLRSLFGGGGARLCAEPCKTSS